MNRAPAALLALAAAAGSGCFPARPSGPDWFYHHAARNLTQKPIDNHDERHFVKVVRRAADAALAEHCRAAGGRHTDPFADGFREGFIDYVEAGGSGEPPYLPPFAYRLTKYRTPEGQRAVEDWYAGFRAGAAAARTSGLRELNYVPLPGPAIPSDAPVRLAPGAGPTVPPTTPAVPFGPFGESLPAPRPAAVPPMLPPTPPRTASPPVLMPPRSLPPVPPDAGGINRPPAPQAAPGSSPLQALPEPTVPIPAPPGAKAPTAPAIVPAAATAKPQFTPAPLRPPVVVVDRPSAPAPTPEPASKGGFDPWRPAAPTAPVWPAPGTPARPPQVTREP